MKITSDDRTALAVLCKVQASEARQTAQRHRDAALRWRQARKLSTAEGEDARAKSAERCAARWEWICALVDAANAAALHPYTASVVGYLRESAESDREPEAGETAEERARWEESARGADLVCALLSAAIGGEVSRG